jgi:starch phosphorylase
VQGVDVWLNNPRRLEEASGTSGMKASANGALNLSILDGWWDEAYAPGVGWAIGHGEVYEDLDYQDRVESQAIHNLLEKEIVPLFYDRGRSGLPRKWIAKMKDAMRALCPVFNSNRMVHEYAQRFYFPAGNRYMQMAGDGNQAAVNAAQWTSNVTQRWNDIRILAVRPESVEGAAVGGRIEITTEINLGVLTPDDVDVEVYHGPVDEHGDIADGDAITMSLAEGQENGTHLYKGTLPFHTSGLHGYTVRVLPSYTRQSTPHELALIHWA